MRHICPGDANARTTASIEAGCCLLAEPPLAIIQLQSSREDTVACEHCLLPLRTGAGNSWRVPVPAPWNVAVLQTRI